ncbi:MAG TPA: tetratricopeptide repeat protein [Terriglobales bacterium]|nr:tetratricopeptide repeat protein [Terriglobales bacterium]
MRFRISVLLVGLLVACSVSLFGQGSNGQHGKQQQPQASDPVPRSDSDEPSEAPPLSANESSSKQTQIDISPPKDDAVKHPDSELEDVTEMHSWNPHKAQKDVEVGEFYLKRKNYRAAEDRFREALVYKPGDAIATYHLAETLDAQGQSAEAIRTYEEYLKIPSSGKFAPEAKKALARLEQKESAQKR